MTRRRFCNRKIKNKTEQKKEPAVPSILPHRQPRVQIEASKMTRESPEAKVEPEKKKVPRRETCDNDSTLFRCLRVSPR